MNSQKLQDIQKKIAEMFEVDQAMRCSYEQGAAPWDVTVDLEHTTQAKKILASLGKWPSLKEFGEDTCRQLWVLVQHADHDIAWQKSCLEMMRSLPEDEVTSWCIAFLTDRICMNEGMPQIYGSQMCFGEDKVWRPYILFEPDSVNLRRKRVGLESIEEYMKGFS